MKVEGGGHYSRAVNDGARTVISITTFTFQFDFVMNLWNIRGLWKLLKWLQ